MYQNFHSLPEGDERYESGFVANDSQTGYQQETDLDPEGESGKEVIMSKGQITAVISFSLADTRSGRRAKGKTLRKP